MSTLKTDAATNDLVVSANTLILIYGADEVEQRLRSRIRMFRGEWFLDLEKGMPYRQLILEKGTSLEAIAAAIKLEILTVPGVLELLEYNQNYDNTTRKLTIDFKCVVSDNQIIEISEVI